MFDIGLSLAPPFQQSLQAQALGILRKFGSNAHVYTPGSTVTSYGAEQVPNPYAGVLNGSWSGGASVTRNGTSIGTANLTLATAAVASKTYKLSFSVSGLSGDTFTAAIGGGANVGNISANGDYSFTVSSSAGIYLTFTPWGGTAGQATITNISVREVITTSTPVSGLLSNNYTLSDGSSGYSAIDGAAGLVLDGAGSVGAELVTNGDFSQGTTGWTTIQTGWSISGGAASVNSAAAGSTFLRQGTTVADAWYMVTFDVTSYTSGSLYPIVGSALSLTAITSAGTGFVRFVKATDTTGFGVYAQSTTTVATIDNISVKPVTGIHATQSTAGNRPSVRRGLYNQFTYASDTSLGTWTRVNLTPTTGQADPYGGTGATRLQVTTTAATLLNVNAAATSTTQTVAFIVKQGTKANLQLLLRNSTTATNFDVGTLAGGVVSGIGWTQASLGNGWTVVAYTRSAGITVGDTLIGYAGVTGSVENAGDDWYFYRAGLFAGTLTAAQILSEGGIPLTTAAAASNAGAGRYWHQYGGSHSLITGNMGFTNAVCITVAGKLDALTGNHVLFGEAAGGVQLYVTSAGAIVFDKNGVGPLASSSPGEIVAGVPFVISALLRSGSAIVRKNGAQKISNATATVFSATTGARIGTDFAGANTCTGAIGQVIPINGVVSDADVLTNERQCAANSPAGPSF